MIQVFELDFGDTNFLSENMQDILDWIKNDLQNLKTGDTDELNYTITVRLMTRQQIHELPEWA